MGFPSGSNLVQRGKCANHAWGFIAEDVTAAPPCVAECRSKFLSDVMPENETFEQVCQMLQDLHRTAGEDAFRAIYCCDAQLCGVNHLQKKGQDPNVNWLIDSCLNVGYGSITDPGPPGSSYTCGKGSGFKKGPWCQVSGSIIESASSTSKRTSTSRTHSSTKTTTHHKTTTEAPSLPSTHSTIPHTATSEAEPSDTSNVNASDTQDGSEHHGGGGISTGVKVTIALIALAVFLVMAVLLFCFFKKKRSRRKGKEVDRETKQLIPPRPPFDESLAITVPPPGVPLDPEAIPLTPPPRLGERRLLPYSPTDTRSSVAGSTVQQHGFPLSPVFSPMSGRLTPRTERALQRKDGGNPLTSPMISSGVDGTMAPPQAIGMAVTGSPPPAYMSTSPFGHGRPPPVRPLRLGDNALDISELLSPGPPPMRALPTRPAPPIPPRGPVSSPPNNLNADAFHGFTFTNPSQDSLLSPDARAAAHMELDQRANLHKSW